MFEDDITIFNRKYDSTLRDYIYIRTYLSGVNVDIKKAINVIKSGLENANSGTIIIPEEANTENREFVKSKEFQKHVKPLTVKQVSELKVRQINEIAVKFLMGRKPIWTLQEGDIVALGFVDYDIDGSNTVSNLRDIYDDVYEIVSVAAMLKGGLPHWEVAVK